MIPFSDNPAKICTTAFVLVNTVGTMEKKQCCECKGDINDIEPMRCGFCEAYLHINQTCCGINIRGLKEAFNQGKLILICTTCRVELNSRSIRSYIADNKQAAPASSIPIELPLQVEQLSDVVKTLSRKIDTLVCAQNQPNWPTEPTWPKLGMKRRRLDETPIYQSSSDCGTKTIDLSDLTVPIVPNADKFWLYLSGLNPLITDADVQKIVSRCLNVAEPADLVRLVPKGKDISSMTFVSYKVGLDQDLKTKALDTTSWPVGLLFREFVNQPKNMDRRTIPPNVPTRSD